MPERPVPYKETRMITELPAVQEYRTLLALAQEQAQQYDGSRSYDALTKILTTLEEKAVALQLAPKESIKDQDWLASQIIAPSQSRKKSEISTLLDIAAESASANVRRTVRSARPRVDVLRKEKEEKSELFIRFIIGPILPPDDAPGPQQGEGEFQPARFQDRLAELTALLRQNDIFIENYIVTMGTVIPSQMRKVSYAVVEIPDINRTILLCDQVGEATFVIHGIGDPRRFLSITKSQLLSHPSIKAHKVVWQSTGYWYGEVGAYLFTEEVWNTDMRPETPAQPQRRERKRLDVHEVVRVRDAILATTTIQQWLDMKMGTTVNQFRILGLSLYVIAGKLGTEGNPFANRLALLQIPRVVFGDDPRLMEAIKKEEEKKEAREVTAETIIDYIKTNTTIQQWLDLKLGSNALNQFKILGLSVGAIATKLGIEGNPKETRLALLQIPRVVFGDDPRLMEAIKKEEEKKEAREVTAETIIDWIKENTTIQQWLDMKIGSKEVNQFRILGLSLYVIARKLGTEGDPCGNRLALLQIPRVVFGDDPQLMEAIKKEEDKKEAYEVTAETIISWIKTNTTIQQWLDMKMGKEAIRGFKILGLSLYVIARKLGTEGDPCGNRLALLQIPRVVFGDDPQLMEAIKKEEEKKKKAGVVR